MLRIPGDWRRPDLGESYALAWHEDLGYGELLPRPERAEMARFHESREQLCGVARTDRDPWRWRLLRFCFRLLDRGAPGGVDYFTRLLPKRGGLVLDIGSRGGRLLAAFAARGIWAIGVEPDAAARAVAARRGVTELEGTAEDIPGIILDGSVRLINLTHVLEHCVEPAAALVALRDKLCVGGALVIEVPNNQCVGARQQEACWRFLDVPRHLNFFTTSSLTRMVEEAGMVVERIDYRGYGRQVTPEWLAIQRRIYHTFVEMGATDIRDRNGFLDAVALLLRTAFAAPGRKYDSVRVVARRS
ncbi:class I SAM-dependent methyltransferase [uncultured Amaricoccus sp.]|uniref:class I SAM-dependent methyltransferase n=1 Tax=uncultured Amaricoccus sp. TaxID=339341 RepID=UPI00260A99E2|nr:class I SAM-dependent methyltransferase [uncultured Amaricoccus sp.]